MSIEGLSRRRALTGAATMGVTLPLLSACGGDGGSANEAGATGSRRSAGTKLAPTSEIPVGGGEIFSDEKVVVTQPSDGEFKGFSAICTHNGCPVTAVQDGTINCTCHGSKFSITDGSVVNGPATSPLDEVTLTIKGGSIRLA